jgi:hypothetical protein
VAAAKKPYRNDVGRGNEELTMERPKRHPLWDIEHELNNMLRILDVWHQKMPTVPRRELRKRISASERMIRGVRNSAVKLLATVIYPLSVSMSSKDSHVIKSKRER